MQRAEWPGQPSAMKESDMGKKNQTGNREQKKPKKPKPASQIAMSAGERAKQQLLGRK
jgi:hypothetical protein